MVILLTSKIEDTFSSERVPLSDQIDGNAVPATPTAPPANDSYSPTTNCPSAPPPAYAFVVEHNDMFAIKK
ncbi:hypothetical protein MAR_013091 [Mya arenaria]|uniref:Uncharacterized protein n=1 Tax=Mya arenaria TaxID=6604 RepID=A0ABY7G260_MYAAR|nr:hypothetical protein MAR_013091 [Mya arenaria]